MTSTRAQQIERRRKWYFKGENTTDKLLDFAEAGRAPWNRAALWAVNKEGDRYVQRTLCWLLGHEVEDDHCGIPEHRHCLFCGQSFPCGITAAGHLTTRPRSSAKTLTRPRPSTVRKELLG